MMLPCVRYLVKVFLQHYPVVEDRREKKKEVKFKLLGMKAGRRSVKAVGKFIPIPCLQYLNLKMARYECPTTCILFLLLIFE